MTHQDRTLVAEVPLTVKLRLLSANSGRPRPGYAVRLWHCDSDDDPGPEGTQTADQAGWVAFTGAFPGAGAGHWPHVHFEVFPDPSAAPVHAAQLALPGDACAQAGRWPALSLATDECFTGGWALEIPSVTGDSRRGLVATRTVGV